MWPGGWRGRHLRTSSGTEPTGGSDAARPDDRPGAGQGEAVQPRGRRAGGPGHTLETLGERLPEGLTDNLAAQLPHEIGEHLRRTELLGGIGTGERFDRNEFVTRVMERSGTDPGQAVYQCRVVFEVLDEAATGGLMDRVRAALPADIRELTTAGSSGGLRG